MSKILYYALMYLYLKSNLNTVQYSFYFIFKNVYCHIIFIVTRKGTEMSVDTLKKKTLVVTFNNFIAFVPRYLKKKNNSSEIKFNKIILGQNINEKNVLIVKRFLKLFFFMF